MTNKIGATNNPIFRVMRFKQEKFTRVYRAEICCAARTPKIHFFGIASTKKSEPISIRYAHIQFHLGSRNLRIQ